MTKRRASQRLLTASHAVFGNGVSFRRIDDKDGRGLSSRKREGQLIILDADDPADSEARPATHSARAGDLPKSVRLPNGELAVAARDQKSSSPTTTRVVATFPGRQIRFNEQKQPIGIVKYKQLKSACHNHEISDGSLVQTESNITWENRTPEGTDVDDVRLQKKIGTPRKEYRGEYSFTKSPVSSVAGAAAAS